MSGSSSAAVAPPFERIARTSAIVVAGIGAAALAGWFFDVPFLKAIHPSLPVMKANTTVLFVAAGVALFLLASGRSGKAARLVARLLAAGVAVLALLTLSEYVLGVNLGIDQLLFAKPKPVGLLPPGRMAVITGVNFTLLGLALLLLDWPPRTKSRPSEFLPLPALWLTLFGLFDYMLDLKAGATQMALNTVGAFLLLGVGVLAARPGRLLSLLVVRSLGGQSCRRLLLSSTALVLILMPMGYLGERLGLLTIEFAVCLFGAVIISLLAAVIFWNSAALDRAEQEMLGAHAAHRGTERELEGFFSLSVDLLCLVASDGCFKRLNPGFEEVLGYTVAELQGKPFLEFVHPDDSERTRAEFEQLCQGQSWIHCESRFLRKDGSYRWLSWSAHPPLADGLIYAVGHDVSERKRRLEEIHRLNAELERRVAERTAALTLAMQDLEGFTYSVSHDLRAPLRRIEGFGRILAEECAGQLSAGAQHYLGRIHEGVRQMARLVEDLLNLAHTGRREVQPQLCRLDSLLDEALAELAHESEGRQIEWRIGKLPFVECDPALMKQVFVNLLSNALKFTQPRERAVIEVAQEARNGRACIVVRDNGVGFSMKYAGKLFKLFQRLHRAEDFEGTGVGLVTVERIMQKHGGAVWAEAELDKGAAFYFTLEPAAAAPPPQAAAGGHPRQGVEAT
jgi:PAS domain S-box-containing protein